MGLEADISEGRSIIQGYIDKLKDLQTIQFTMFNKDMPTWVEIIPSSSSSWGMDAWDIDILEKT